MAMTGALQSHCNGDGSATQVTPDVIRKALDSLEDPLQKVRSRVFRTSPHDEFQDFIEKCLNADPAERPTARQLLFHSILFEVHSLKLIAAHAIAKSKFGEHLSEDDLRVPDAKQVAATCKFKEVTYEELPTFQVRRHLWLWHVSPSFART